MFKHGNSGCQPQYPVPISTRVFFFLFFFSTVLESDFTSTGNNSSCFFYSGGFNFLMQLQFLAPVELFFKQLNRYSF